MAADMKKLVESGRTVIGIEFGSTRIKAVMADPLTGEVLASGGHGWENRLENGLWTYHLDEIIAGLQDCYADLKRDVAQKCGATIRKAAAIGISAMMHGYMAFDKEGSLLIPFRTWRNSNTKAAAGELTQLFNFNIPERWSVAHLYQCILDGEEHLKKLHSVSTLSGFIHRRLTGRAVLGVGDAAGMFPVDSDTMDYRADFEAKFNDLLKSKGFSFKLKDIFPKVLCAGEDAGTLTAEGARLLDPKGDLEAGIPLCPPEGDAGTGMAATNSVRVRTGNVSAGTSIFAMIVLEHALRDLHREIDNVTTPDGKQVAMVHANNCTSDLNAWVSVFREFAKLSGHEMPDNDLFALLYNNALENADPDCGGVISYGYLSGEFITGMDEGRPLLARTPEARFTLANLMRSNLDTSLGAVRLGMDILKEEGVAVDRLLGHGGLFKTKGVGQQIMADALNIPVWVMTTAGEGGPWGMALLAAFLVRDDRSLALPEFLDQVIFKNAESSRLDPDPKGVAGFNSFMQRYTACLPVEKAATECLK
ncbi:MAG: xylulokinase [Succinivibrio sp.]